MEEVKRQLDYHHVRLADFLADGDRLRSGDLSTSKFRNGLSRAGVQLTGSELTALENSYRSPRVLKKDMLDWRRFLADVENSVVQKRPEPEDIDTIDQGLLADIILRIKTIVDQRRLNLKPYFQDYDRSHFQQVTQNQFSAVMSTLDIPVSSLERITLFKAFMVFEGKKETNRVNYKAFIKRVDDQESS